LCLRSASLRGQRRKVLLARLQGGCFFAGRILEVHAEPNRPEHKTDNAGTDVLSNLPPLLIRELLHLCIVGLDLGPDLCAVCVSILGLNCRNRLWIATGACS